MQRKLNQTSPADAFNVRKAAVFPLSVRWICNFILPLNTVMSSDTFKNILPFPYMEMSSWFKRIKITYE